MSLRHISPNQKPIVPILPHWHGHGGPRLQVLLGPISFATAALTAGVPWTITIGFNSIVCTRTKAVQSNRRHRATLCYFKADGHPLLLRGRSGAFRSLSACRKPLSLQHPPASAAAASLPTQPTLNSARLLLRARPSCQTSVSALGMGDVAPAHLS